MRKPTEHKDRRQQKQEPDGYLRGTAWFRMHDLVVKVTLRVDRENGSVVDPTAVFIPDIDGSDLRPDCYAPVVHPLFSYCSPIVLLLFSYCYARAVTYARNYRYACDVCACACVRACVCVCACVCACVCVRFISACVNKFINF